MSTQAVFPNSFYLKTGGIGFSKVVPGDLEDYLQKLKNLDERAKSIFREVVRDNPSQKMFAIGTGYEQRDYYSLGQRWRYDFAMIGPPLSDFGLQLDESSPLYRRYETEPQMIAEIPIESPIRAVDIPREIGCCERILLFLNSLITKIFNVIKNCFAWICGAF